MSVRRSLAWMVLSQVGFFVLQFGGSVVLARLLSPYEMGVYALAAATVGILGIIQAFGLTNLVIREAETGPGLLASAFTMNTILAVVVACGVAGVASLGGYIFAESGVQQVLLLLAPIPLIGVLEFLPASMLERDGEFRAIAVVGLCKGLLATVLTVVLALEGYSYMSMAWGWLAGAVLSATMFMLIGHRHVSFRLSLLAWRHILHFGLRQLAIQGVSAFSARMSELILGRLLGLAALGLFGRASNLNNLLWSNINLVVGRVMLVDLAQQRRLGVSLRHAYLRSVDIMTAILWPAFAGLACLAGPFIRMVYGAEWVAAAAPLALLSVAAILLVSITMTWEVFVVCHEEGRQARFEFMRAGVGTAFFTLGCAVSLSGAAAGRVAEALFAITLYRSHLQRMTDTVWTDFARIYRRNALLTVAACGPAAILMFAFQWRSTVPPSLVALAMTSGAGLWLLALRLTNHILLDEVRRLLRRGGRSAEVAPSITAP